jgi:hypothetical protein
LASQGDSILTYCLDGNDRPVFLSGFTYIEGGWAEPGLSDYGPGTSSLPDRLVETGSVAVPFFPNYEYIGTSLGSQEAMLEALSNETNYAGSTDRKSIAMLEGETSSSIKLSTMLAGMVAVSAGFFLL